MAEVPRVHFGPGLIGADEMEVAGDYLAAGFRNVASEAIIEDCLAVHRREARREG